MQHLKPADLLTLESYARERATIRARMIDYRAARRLEIGPNCTWSFEDRETVRYQVQEMLRTERVFEAAGIEGELAAYNPLVPDGRNFKATLLIEYPDPAERAQQLAALRGLERRCWMQVAGCGRTYAIADEDLERENEHKTSAVHFLRFELDDAMARAFKSGAAMSAGVDHEAYRHSVDPLPSPLCDALRTDLA